MQFKACLTSQAKGSVCGNMGTEAYVVWHLVRLHLFRMAAAKIFIFIFIFLVGISFLREVGENEVVVAG